MSWKISIIDEAQKDYKKLDNGVRKQVLAGILKVSKAPLPSPDGYGNPLGNKNGNNVNQDNGSNNFGNMNQDTFGNYDCDRDITPVDYGDAPF